MLDLAVLGSFLEGPVLSLDAMFAGQQRNETTPAMAVGVSKDADAPCPSSSQRVSNSARGLPELESCVLLLKVVSRQQRNETAPTKAVGAVKDLNAPRPSSSGRVLDLAKGLPALESCVGLFKVMFASRRGVLVVQGAMFRLSKGLFFAHRPFCIRGLCGSVQSCVQVKNGC